MAVIIQRKFQEISEYRLSGEIPEEYDFGIPMVPTTSTWNDLRAIPLGLARLMSADNKTIS